VALYVWKEVDDLILIHPPVGVDSSEFHIERICNYMRKGVKTYVVVVVKKQ